MILKIILFLHTAQLLTAAGGRKYSAVNSFHVILCGTNIIHLCQIVSKLGD